MRYILDGKIPIPCDDLDTWARWMLQSDRGLQQEDIGPYWISTVFLGFDHSYGTGPPLLFETMIFTRSGAETRLQVEDAPVFRAPTWEIALETHAEAVAWAKAQLT